MSNAPQLSVIIPVLNKWELTRNCLQSLAQHTSGHDMEVIVVDNASTDATPAELTALGSSLFGPRFTAIRNNENINFGPASNLGAKAAASGLLFFLNNDTLATPNWLPPLLAALDEEPKPAAVGPLLLYMDDTVQHLGMGFSLAGLGHLYQCYPAAHPVVKNPRRVQGLTAAALLLPKALFFDFGGFYEEYKNGFEDVDLCLHLSHAGHAMRCVSNSVIYHLESQTPGRKGSEEHNSRILGARCGHLVKPDTHLHAVNDGLKPVLNDTLAVDIHMGDRDSLLLIKEAKTRDLLWVYQQMELNPGWAHGAALLRDKGEAAGHADIALYAAQTMLGQYYTFETCEALLRTAVNLRNEASIELAQQKTEYLKRLYSGEHPPILDIFRQQTATARSLGDKDLLALLDAKKDDINNKILRLRKA